MNTKSMWRAILGMIAGLWLCGGSLCAQDDNGGPGGPPPGEPGNGGPGGPGGGGRPGAPVSGEQQVLQKAVDESVPVAQLKDALAKYRAAHKVKQAALEAAQADLKNVLSVRQEAKAVILGLLQ